jgi:hypothetical protein
MLARILQKLANETSPEANPRTPWRRTLEDHGGEPLDTMEANPRTIKNFEISKFRNFEIVP